MSSTGFEHIRPIWEAFKWTSFCLICGGVVGWGIYHDRPVEAICGTIGVFFLFALVRHLFLVAGIEWKARKCQKDFQIIRNMNICDFVLAHFGRWPSLLAQHLAALQSLGRERWRTEFSRSVAASRSVLESRNAQTHNAAIALQSMAAIGTMVGASMVVSSMQGVLDTNAEGLIDGLIKCFTGLGTAFYSSVLGGYLGSFLLAGLANSSDTSIDELIKQVESIGESCISYEDLEQGEKSDA